MSNYRQSLGLVSTGLWLLLGCGGRSDMTDYESGLDSTWGGTSLHAGGSTATLTSMGGLTAKGGNSSRGGAVAQGGSAAVGGRSATGGTFARGGASGSGNVPAQGGTQWRTGGGGFGGYQPASGSSGAGGVMPAGGSTSKVIKGDCCVAHDTPGCISSSAESCVCKRDVLCCLVAWDAVCVSEMFARGCDSCMASGGTGNGGTWNAGGVANGGVQNGGAVSTRGSVALGGITGKGGAASGGVTSIASGGMPPAGGGIMNSGGTVSTATTPPAHQALIDDLEDGNGDLIQIGGRDGYWFTLNDGTTTGTQEPVWGGRIRNAYAITDRSGSAFAAWTQGGGFVTWGAGFGLYLRTSARYFNATRYKGITFWAKVAPGRANVVRLNVSDIQTEADGGYCTECWDYFGATIVMSTNWERYGFVWSDLRQQGWGTPLAASVDSANIRSIEFYTAAGVNFEIYVDDIAFIP